MKKVLVLTAILEVATGMALLIVPSFVSRLLLGEELSGVAIPVARVTGIALIGLGLSCWPGPPLIGDGNLQCGCRALSCLRRCRRRVYWHLSVASGRPARDPHSPSWKRLANYRTA